MLVGIFFNNYHCYIYRYLDHRFCLSSFPFSLIFIFITVVYATDNTTVISKPSVTMIVIGSKIIVNIVIVAFTVNVIAIVTIT